MTMTQNTRPLLLAVAALALLTAGCDNRDPEQAQKSGSWFGWLMGKDDTSAEASFSADDIADLLSYDRDTMAGSFLASQYAQYRQDWGSANIYLDKMIAMDPSNIDLQQRSMILSMQAGDYAKALTMARKVLTQDKKNLLALLFIGVDELSNQKYDDAQDTFQKMPASGITDFVKPILSAWAMSPSKKVDIDMLSSEGPLHAYHALLIADYMGKVKDPSRFLTHVMAGGAADKHILESMADIYARQGDKKLATEIYDTLLTDVAQETTSRYKLLKDKRDNLSLAASGKIQSPTNGAAELFYNMGRILFQDQSYESALVFARLADHLNPTNDDHKMLIAAMLNRTGHTDQAVSLYKAVAPTAPGYPEAQRSAAELLEKSGKPNDAVALMEKTYKTTNDLNTLIEIGDIYRRADKHADAIKAYDRVVAALDGKVSSDYWQVLYARGMSYEQMGNYTMADADLLAALEFQPEQPYLLNYLGYSWVDRGKNFEQAMAMIQKAVALKSDDGYIVDSLGWAYYKAAEYDRAVPELERAVEMVPYDPIINDHLGDAYWRVGRKNEARFQWERAKNHSTKAEDITKLDQKIAQGLVESPAPAQASAKVDAPSKAAPAIQTQ